TTEASHDIHTFTTRRSSDLEELMLEGVSQSNTTIIGDKKVVKEKLDTLIEITGADELIINSQIYDIDSRIHSYKLISINVSSFSDRKSTRLNSSHVSFLYAV